MTANGAPRRHLLLFCSILLLGAASALGAQQESAQEDQEQTAPSAAERVEDLRDAIAELETRQQASEGEDRELYEDLIRRRSPELREALAAWVKELSAEDASPDDETLERARELVAEQRAWLVEWLGLADTRIQELRRELPDAEPQRELEIENDLTRINERVDDLLAALVETAEHLEALGADPGYEALDARLLRRAELTAARIEKVLEDIEVAERRLMKLGEGDAAAAQETHLNALREKLSGTTGTLENVADLIEQRGGHVAPFRELLLESTGELTVETLDAEVAISFVERTLGRWRDTLQERAPTWILRAILFLVVLFAAWLLSRLVRRILRRVLDTSAADFSRLLEKFIVSTSANLVLLLGILVALSQIGIEVAPFLAGLGVAGLVLGLALQDSLSNLFSGLMILLTRPYDVDDTVDAAGVSGTVREMSLMTTTILTFDNKKLVIPNNKIWGDTIQNVTAQDIRRIDLEFGVGYDDDIDNVSEILDELVTTHELILEDPAPTIRLHRLDDSAVTFIVRPWAKRDDYWTVYWDLMTNVKKRFDAEGISIPFPQRDVHVIGPKEESSDAPLEPVDETAPSAREPAGENLPGDVP